MVPYRQPQALPPVHVRASFAAIRVLRCQRGSLPLLVVPRPLPLPTPPVIPLILLEFLYTGKALTILVLHDIIALFCLKVNTCKI